MSRYRLTRFNTFNMVWDELDSVKSVKARDPVFEGFQVWSLRKRCKGNPRAAQIG